MLTEVVSPYAQIDGQGAAEKDLTGKFASSAFLLFLGGSLRFSFGAGTE